MASFSWMGLVNKVLNLGVLVGACVYLAKKYAIPYIKKSLEEREFRILELKTEAAFLQEKNVTITRQTSDIQTQAVHLLGKITIWKEALKKQEEERRHERLRVEQISQEYLKARASGLCSEYVKRVVVPEVFPRTEKRLRDFFSKEEHQKAYMATCLRALVEKKETCG